MRSTKRRFSIIAGALFIIASTFLIIALTATRDPLARAFVQIEEGMGLEEVEDIIGRPCDSGGWTWRGIDPEALRFSEWFGQDSKLEILSRDGKVVGKEQFNYAPDLVQRLKRWFGWG